MAKPKQVIYFIVFSLLLLSSKSLHAEPRRATESLHRETVLLPSSVPDKTGFILFSFLTIHSDTEILAQVAIYDDPGTQLSVDYVELYDGSGGLLAISWVDRFGIRGTAIDRGLLQGEASSPEGVLVLLQVGTLS